MNDEPVVNEQTGAKGRLARWLRELDEPPELRRIKKIDLQMLWFLILVPLGALGYVAAQLTGLGEMVEGLPNVHRDGPMPNRLLMWFFAAMGVIGVAGITACLAYKVYRRANARRSGER